MSDAQIVPGQRIRFSSDDLEMLGRKLSDLIDELEDQHSPYIDNIAKWWDWYDAKPLATKRSDPWEGASNVVVPLIKVHTDAITARFVNTIFATSDVWSGKNKNDEAKEFVPHVVDWLNYAGDDNEFDLFLPTYDMIGEAVPIGSAVNAINWVARRRQVFMPGRGGKPKPVSVEISRGPVIENIPREQILWQPDRPIHQSDIIVRQSLMTWGELVRMVQLADWDEEQVEASKGKFNVDLSRSSRVRKDRARTAGLREEALAYRVHDIREVHVEWPILKGMGIEAPGKQDTKTISVPLVITLHKGSRRIFRVIAKPYFTRDQTFYEFQFRKNPRRANSAGVAKMLQHMQIAITTMVNQSIDVVTLANSVVGITNDRKMLSQEFRPNKLFYTSDPVANFVPINLQKGIVPDVTLINLVSAFSERLTGINDPSLGREVRMGGHPSPATSTLTMLQESKEVFRASMKMIRREMSRMAEDIATLYQQFESGTDGKIERAIGRVDAQKVKRWLFPTEFPIGGNIGFDLRAISETMNPEQERQKAVLVSQLTANYFSRVMQALQVAGQAQAQVQQGLDPKIAQAMTEAAGGSIRALTESHKRFLESSDVDNIEAFLFQLQESNNDPRVIDEIGTRVGGRLEELAASGDGRQLPPVPVGPDQLPVGAAGAPGTSGF